MNKRLCFALVVLAFIAGALILSGDDVSAVPACPNPKFIANHLCVDCSTLDNAAYFSKYRPFPPRRNTVFFGRPQFEVKTYMADRCGNIEGCKAALCTKTDAETYTCRWLGNNCFAEHSISSGHLHYQNIKCY